ncbi:MULTISPECIES: FxLD family lanthipeptide [Streptomycetaceae]|uniref:FxLD family lantipeptide n=1 Tax=Streptantibioticus cattleyicolor (strain ATCC 35852 / DSM 46488 / JCM 4925 / NBRC 14057 / NRRL 8057) TaxID=1003195 RepID=F8JWU8_STREN|nr:MULTISPECIES: FxLD family lanthipeptide [Streptomycetaceae]AEW92912.1 hypothetical protein SCATT_05410 [Streptantibioticus cattleyicolor NRRL 8057 = DSM 46488]MYS57662.1 FxLD family lantipeptide [Streptomyces sp. SID5468]CCB73269.1 protein of unknown function [Streptantibioticus cattleyicolor NRRL 8057 = DSM 46488]
MPDVLLPDNTRLADDPADDDFTLDVRIVVATGPMAGYADCPTDDGCGNTCANGASACDSYIGDPA